MLLLAETCQWLPVILKHWQVLHYALQSYTLSDFCYLFNLMFSFSLLCSPCSQSCRVPSRLLFFLECPRLRSHTANSLTWLKYLLKSHPPPSNLPSSLSLKQDLPVTHPLFSIAFSAIWHSSTSLFKDSVLVNFPICKSVFVIQKSVCTVVLFPFTDMCIAVENLSPLQHIWSMSQGPWYLLWTIWHGPNMLTWHFG